MGAIDPRYPPPTRLITAESLIREGREAWNKFFASLTPAQLQELGDPRKGVCRWSFWARAEQFAPTGDWTTWLYLGGRGVGKTRSGAETVLGWVRDGINGRPRSFCVQPPGSRSSSQGRSPRHVPSRPG